MGRLENSSLDRSHDRDAAELVATWRQAQPVLEAERLRRLHSLSERDAAEQFASLLHWGGVYPLRPTSGLVEQQRILQRMRERT